MRGEPYGAHKARLERASEDERWAKTKAIPFFGYDQRMVLVGLRVVTWFGSGPAFQSELVITNRVNLIILI